MSARAYASLAKPGITLFITITAAVGYLTAAGHIIDRQLFACTLLATALLAAGAAATNQIIERKHDALMRRTSTRALPSGAVSVSSAATLAALLATTGALIALSVLPRVTLLLLFCSYVSYIAYTLLKRRTPLCTLVGGIPGALPVLAGWLATGAAVTPTAVALVAVMFVWQMPHFLAIGWLCRDDYRRAGFRVISALDRDGRISARICVVYALLLVPISLVPFLTGSAHVWYFGIAAVCGLVFLWQSERFARQRNAKSARSLFFTSLVYLPAVFSALVFLR